MPTVFTKDGFRFFVYSNDHAPIHVRKGDGEAVFEIEGEVALRESVGFKTRELNLAENLAEEHKTLIIQKWHEFFV
jgi:hypothetical protein